MDALVIGGSGLVGTNVVRHFEANGAEVVGTYTSKPTPTADKLLDKTDSEEVLDFVKKQNPDLIIDTAAFHAVDECEQNRDRAFRVNAQGTRNVAVAANTVNAHFVYLSTDYVFRGIPSETPYTEENAVAPCNYYAETKYSGEQATKIADTHTILRPSVIYGIANDNFLTWALSELDAGNELGIVDDQISRPTYAPDLALACFDVVEQSLTGTYHATGPQSCSRYEFTVLLAEVFGYDSDLVSPISTEELGQEAPRPEDSSLDSTELYHAIEYDFREPQVAFRDLKGKT